MELLAAICVIGIGSSVCIWLDAYILCIFHFLTDLGIVIGSWEFRKGSGYLGGTL